MSQKVVINACFGGFGLSHAAYEKLIEWGVPVRKYVKQQFDPETRLYKPQPANDGEVIFDRELTPPGEAEAFETYWTEPAVRRLLGRYWETWIGGKRDDPRLVRLVEELGEAANGAHAKLKIVEVPDGVEFVIEEYDGSEHIAEAHRTWE